MMTAPLQGEDVDLERYKDFPFLQSMLRFESLRNAALDEEGKYQMNAPLSSDGWGPSLFIIQARALDWILKPWCAVVLHAVIYTTIQELFFQDLLDGEEARDYDSWELFFGIMLNSTLSFLLVFRLNRAAGRYWLARELWGNFVARGRTVTAGILVHSNHAPHHRDEALRWTSALCLCVMALLRGTKVLPEPLFLGILIKDEVQAAQRNTHPPLFVAAQIRYHLHEIFKIDADTPVGIANALSQQMDSLEIQLNTMLDCCGGMERIRSTPLPMVYVSHLRTFLMLALLLFPYVWGPAWGWGTIPVVATAAFSLLGIDAAASEVEAPFQQRRVNALNMDEYCKGLLSNIQQQIQHHADRFIAKKVR
jgi:putative membrane protein|uniref:Uncharacterized protein n=1 Tax=Phaeodactylum tricornutum TaxID=2850 RepID=A0A8J9SBX8_PHATR